jgi:hypothetical protein
MKKFTFPVYILIVLTLIMVLQSCSVDKRVYRKGYHIEWNSKVPAAAEENTQVASAATNENAPAGDILPIENILVPVEAVDEASTLTATLDEETVLILKHSIVEVTAPQQPEADTEKAEAPVQKEVVLKKKPLVSTIKKQLLAPDQTGDIRPHWMAILSLIAGILALVAYYGAIPLGILAIVFGAIALRRINNDPATYRGRGMAIAGIVCGIVALAIVLTVLVFII